MKSEDRDSLQSLMSSLHHLNRAMRQRTFDSEERLVPRVQWTLLRHLFYRDRWTVGQLADRLEVRQSTMSQMLDRLEKKRLIFREASTEDARIKQIGLTEAGRELIRTIETKWTEVLEPAFENMEENERRSLAALLAKLASSVEFKRMPL